MNFEELLEGIKLVRIDGIDEILGVDENFNVGAYPMLLSKNCDQVALAEKVNGLMDKIFEEPDGKNNFSSAFKFLRNSGPVLVNVVKVFEGVNEEELVWQGILPNEERAILTKLAVEKVLRLENTVYKVEIVTGLNTDIPEVLMSIRESLK